MEVVIKDGWHNLEGFCSYHGNDGYNDIDGYIIRIDGKNYLAYEDPSDGYRSYSEFKETENACTTIFPPQRVNVMNYNCQGEYGRDCGIRIFNAKGELILHVGTEDYEDYYPTAVSEWHPENLPINESLKVVFNSNLPEELAMELREYILADQGNPDALSHLITLIEGHFKKAYEKGAKDTIAKIKASMGEGFELDEHTRHSDVLVALENTLTTINEIEKLL